MSMDMVGASKIQSIVRWIAYGALALVPLWFLPYTYDVLDFNKQVLLVFAASVGLLLYFFDVIRSGRLEYKFDRILWIVTAFVIAGIISTISSVSWFTSFFGSGTSRATSLAVWLALAVLVFLASSTTKDQGKRFREILTISISFSLLLGLLQMFGFGIFSGSYATRGFNTVGSINSLGLLAAAMLPLFLNIFSWNGRWHEILAGVFRVIGFISAIFLLLIVNQSFIWIVAIVGMLSFIGLRSLNQPGAFRLKIFALPLAIIVLGSFVMLIRFDWTSVRSKLPVEVWLSHKASYGIAKDTLSDRLLGYGPENYGIAFDMHRPPEVANTIFFENRFFDGRAEFYTLMTEGGLAMLAAIAIMLLLVVWQTFSIVRNKDRYQGVALMIWPVIMSLCLGLFLYPFNVTLWAVFVSMLVIFSALKASSQESRVIDLEKSGSSSFIGSIGFVVGLIAVLFAGYYMAKNFQSETQFAQAAKATDPDSTVMHYGLAINANQNDSRLYQLVSQGLMQRVASDIKSGPKKDETKDAYTARINYYIDSALSIAKKATELEPYDSENWMNLGYMYQNVIGLRQEADVNAIAGYNENLKRDPSNSVAYARIGATYLTLSDAAASRKEKSEVVLGLLTQAEQSLLKAVALSRNYGLANYNLAVVYERQGRLADAVKQFEKLALADPRNAGLFFQLGLLHYRNDQKDLAMDDWKHAIELFPEYANARWYLSLALEEKGQLQDALNQIKEIEKTNPDNAVIKQREDQLSAGIQKFPPGNVIEQQPIN